MTLSSFIISLRVFLRLLWFDVRFLGKDFWDNFLDSLIWPTALIAVNGYVMPAAGMPANYGAFITVSMLIIMGSYTAWSAAFVIATDLAGEQAISYELTLPLPYWMVWLEKGIYLSIKAGTFNITSFLAGRIILGPHFDMTNFSWWKFITIYTLSSLFFGMFSLWSTVITKTVEAHTRLDLRLVGPMFYITGFSASWEMMNSVSPTLGIITICMPWTYAYEGTRAAILGQNGFLSFELCTIMITMFLLLFTLMAIWLFKRRMDCV
jgi:ABC-type multidrug transport system permease subunit